jgi:hypothetical protein
MNGEREDKQSTCRFRAIVAVACDLYVPCRHEPWDARSAASLFPIRVHANWTNSLLLVLARYPDIDRARCVLIPGVRSNSVAELRDDTCVGNGDGDDERQSLYTQSKSSK